MMNGILERWTKESLERQKELMDRITKLSDEMREERREREEERRKERKEWKEEKRQLTERLYKLERSEKRKKRAERKNNIVIKGERWNEGKVESEVKEFLRAELRVEAEIKKAWLVGAEAIKNKVVVELGSWENKRTIMGKNDWERGIWIEDDLTRKEREIQVMLRNRARELREKGDREVRVGYLKMFFGGKWIRWNEREGKLDMPGEEIRAE